MTSEVEDEHMVLEDMGPFVDHELKCIEPLADQKLEYSVPWANRNLAVASS
jgi:hypothetical protein